MDTGCKINIYLCHISNAFHSVHRDNLANYSWQNGISDSMFRFLYSYLALREAVVVQGHKSNDFIIQDDSRQCLPRIYGMYSLKVLMIQSGNAFFGWQNSPMTWQLTGIIGVPLATTKYKKTFENANTHATIEVSSGGFLSMHPKSIFAYFTMCNVLAILFDCLEWWWIPSWLWKTKSGGFVNRRDPRFNRFLTRAPTTTQPGCCSTTRLMCYVSWNNHPLQFTTQLRTT